MAGINKVIIVGNLGKDPETRYMPNGNAVVGFSIATSEKWKDKNTGESNEKTEWHNITVFGKLAEICSQYLKKGSKVYIEGKLQTDKWQDNNGNDRYTTKIIANQMQMLDSRSGSNNNSQNNTDNQNNHQQQNTTQNQNQDQGNGYQRNPTNTPPANNQGKAPPDYAGAPDFDDDILF